MIYAYPARVRGSPGDVVCQFRDLPEAIAGGKSRAAAIREAERALEAALWFRLKQDREIPAPSPKKRGDVLVPVPPAQAAKVAFAVAFYASRLSRLELGRRLKLDVKEIRRMLDPAHPTKIDRLDEAMGVFGKRLLIAEIAA